MSKLFPSFLFFHLLVALLISASVPAQAADTPATDNASAAKTNQNPEVSLDILRLQLKPLTLEELEGEAKAWLELLKKKTQQISEAEIASKQLKGQISETNRALNKKEEIPAATTEDESVTEVEIAESAPSTNETAALPDDDSIAAIEEDPSEVIPEASAAVVENEKQERAEVLTTITVLRDERVGIIDRLNVVLEEWDKKGGEVEYYENYINAVSGISVDVSDTSALWITAKGWIVAPSGGIRWGINLIKFVAILFVTLLLKKAAVSLTKRGLNRASTFSALLREFLIKMAGRVVLLIGFIMALGALEINVAPVLALIGAAGFVVAFALQGTLSNLASGLLIMVYRPFDVGDFVNAAGISGTVSMVNLFSTTIKTPDNQVMIAPNNDIWQGVITNVTGSATRRVDLVFGIGYDSDMATAERILNELVKEHELILEDPAPNIKVHELADSSVNFICRPWVKTADYWAVYWDLTRKVKERFDAEGISIPYPQTDVHIHQVSK